MHSSTPETALGAIDHVAIVTPSLAESEAVYLALGLRVLHRERLEAEGIDVTLLGTIPERTQSPDYHPPALAASGRLVELLCPFHQRSGVARFLRDRGPGLHHVSFAVDDMTAMLERCRAAGLQVVEPAPRLGILGRAVAFLHPRSVGGTLIELVERPTVNVLLDHDLVAPEG